MLVSSQARVARAFSSLHARLHAHLATSAASRALAGGSTAPVAAPHITADDLWNLCDADGERLGPPEGFAIAKLVASSADRCLQFSLQHVLKARAGRLVFDLIYAKRDVLPVELPSAAAEEGTYCLAGGTDGLYRFPCPSLPAPH